MKPKSPRLIIKLEADDLAWLAERASHLGVDSETLARMMIRQARLGPSAVVATPIAQPPRDDIRDWQAQDRIDEAAYADPAPTEGQSLDSLMQAAPSLLDEAFQAQPEPEHYPEPQPMPAYEAQAMERAIRAAADRGMPRYNAPRAPQRYEPARPRFMQPGFAGRMDGYSSGLQMPGSQTRAVDVNPTLAHGAVMGDGYGNVVRQNTRHYGFRGN